MHPALIELELLVGSCTKTLELVAACYTEGAVARHRGKSAELKHTHFTVGSLGFMADNRSMHPLGLCMDQAAAAKEPATDPASAAPIFGHRLLLPLLLLCLLLQFTCYFLLFLQYNIYMENFSDKKRFFFVTAGRWNKWMERQLIRKAAK